MLTLNFFKKNYAKNQCCWQKNKTKFNLKVFCISFYCWQKLIFLTDIFKRNKMVKWASLLLIDTKVIIWKNRYCNLIIILKKLKSFKTIKRFWANHKSNLCMQATDKHTSGNCKNLFLLLSTHVSQSKLRV